MRWGGGCLDLHLIPEASIDFERGGSELPSGTEGVEIEDKRDLG